MAIQIQNAIIVGAFDAFFPVIGIIGAGYLDQSPYVGASAAIIGQYANGMGDIKGAIAASAGAILLPQYLSFFPGGILGTVLGGVVGGSIYAMIDTNLMRPGRTGIITPDK